MLGASVGGSHPHPEPLKPGEGDDRVQGLGYRVSCCGQVLEAASAQATAQMVAERGNLVERLAEVEDWHILPLGGVFISAVPGRWAWACPPCQLTGASTPENAFNNLRMNCEQRAPSNL